MKGKPVFYVFAFFILCLIAGFVLYLSWQYFQSGGKPVVTILSPIGAQILESGDGLAVAVKAEADVELDRIILYVDGQPYAEESASGETSFTAVIPWYASGIGKHTIEAVAIDRSRRSSEPAQLIVGVIAKLKPNSMDYVYMPPEESTDGSGSGVGQIMPVNDRSGSSDGGAVGNVPDEILGNPLLPEDLDALPFGQDAPPQIILFNATPSRNGQAITIQFHIEAQDDLGLDRLEVSVLNEAADNSSSKTILCFNEPTCFIDDVYPFAGTGTWLLGVRAFDTSGQSSAPELIPVEIVDGGQNEPAIAILDLAAARPLVAELFVDRQNGIPIDPADIDTNIVINNAVTAENGCVQGLVEPRAGGHFISAVFLCEKEIEGALLEWKIEAWPTHGGSTIKVHYVLMEDRNSLGLGDNFSYLYETPFCGTDTNYRIHINLISQPDIFGHRQLYSGHGIDIWNVPGADCGENSYIRDLQAIPDGGGVNLTWSFLQTNDFPSGLAYSIIGHNPAENEIEVIHNGIVGADQLSQGDAPVSFNDETAQCGFTQYFYSVSIQSNIQKPSYTNTVQVDRIPCPEGALGNLQIQLNPGYTLINEANGLQITPPVYWSAITAHSVIPPGFLWPAGNNLVLKLQVKEIGFGSGGTYEPLPGNPTEIQINDSVRVNGFVFDSTALVKCSATHHQWAYVWELSSDGQVLETGPEVKIKSPPCLPRTDDAPFFTSIRGSDDPAACGGVPYCVIVEWGTVPPSEEGLSASTRANVDGLGLYRSLSSRQINDVEPVPDQFWALPVDQFTYIDIGIECTPQIAGFSYRYEIYPMAQGVFNSPGRTTAFIESPICGQSYNVSGNVVR